MSSISPTPNKQPQGYWPLMATYVVPPLAASIAIVPAYFDMAAKSAQQKGLPVPKITILEGLKGGFKVAPTVGIIVGTQMIIQSPIETALVGDSNKGSLLPILASSVIIGSGSAPILAIFNGQTMGWSPRESLRRFSPKQGLAIAVQETAFVGGISAADRLAAVMKQKFGNNKTVEYIAAFTAGAAGSLAGHPANTALTRWQSGMTVDSFSQTMCGAARKARAVGVFSVIYKFGKETLNSVENSK